MSSNLSGGRMGSSRISATVLTLAALTLLVSCRNADDDNPARSASRPRDDHRDPSHRRHRRPDRHGAGADRNQPVVPDRRPPDRAHRRRRRHRPSRPAAGAGWIRRTKKAACRRRGPSWSRRRRNWSRPATITSACATWSPRTPYRVPRSTRRSRCCRRPSRRSKRCGRTSTLPRTASATRACLPTWPAS